MTNDDDINELLKEGIERLQRSTAEMKEQKAEWIEVIERIAADEENERLAREFEALADKPWIPNADKEGLRRGAELIRQLGEKR